MSTFTESSDAAVLVWARAAIRSGVAADLRIAAELSQAEVAEAVGVTSSAICKWEAGQRVPRGGAAVRYSRFLESLVNALAKEPVAA
jgi:transcriptional regulator with XRE-family HTH domain